MLALDVERGLYIPVDQLVFHVRCVAHHLIVNFLRLTFPDIVPLQSAGQLVRVPLRPNKQGVRIFRAQGRVDFGEGHGQGCRPLGRHLFHVVTDGVVHVLNRRADELQAIVDFGIIRAGFIDRKLLNRTPDHHSETVAHIDILHLPDGARLQVLRPDQFEHGRLHMGVRYNHIPGDLLAGFEAYTIGLAVADKDVGHRYIAAYNTAMGFQHGFHGLGEHAAAAFGPFAPAVVEHGLPAHKIAGRTLPGGRTALGGKPQQRGFQMGIGEVFIHHTAVTGKDALKTNRLLTFFEHASV